MLIVRTAIWATVCLCNVHGAAGWGRAPNISGDCETLLLHSASWGSQGLPEKLKNGGTFVISRGVMHRLCTDYAQIMHNIMHRLCTGTHPIRVARSIALACVHRPSTRPNRALFSPAAVLAWPAQKLPHPEAMVGLEGAAQHSARPALLQTVGNMQRSHRARSQRSAAHSRLS